MTKNGRRVIFQPQTHRASQRGINQLVNAIRPTLGPVPRMVAIDRILDERMPELLDNGGLIAKRIIQLADRHEDPGAMFLRDVLTRLADQVGDGTATAAVLFQAIYNEGVRYLAAGGNGMRLRSALEAGQQLILDELAGMTSHLSGQEALAKLAHTICYDETLADMLGEIFDIMGEYGRLEIRPGRSRALEREYVEGMYWERGLMSRQMANDPIRQRTELEEAAVLISDLKIETPEQLFPALETALRADIKALLIVAAKISDKALGFLLANKRPDKFQVIAVHTPEYGSENQAAALQDLAILTGGNPFLTVTGDSFARITEADFGHARRVWADLRNFGIIGGQGNPRELRRHIQNLRTTHDRTDDLVSGERLLKRIGMLLGGSATLWVGGTTEMQINERVAVAKRTAAAMRGAMREGVLPGGGAALLACRPALQSWLTAATDPDERAAYRILHEALAAPFRAIVHNAGYDPSQILARLNRAETPASFDVRTGQVVDVAAAGLFDAAVTQRAALHAAISSAALALTIDVIVHRNGHEQSLQPVRGPGQRKRV